MQTIKDKIKKQEYRNWVKGTLGIDQTKRAVSEYVKEKFTLYLEGKATLHGQTNQSFLTPEELAHLRDEMKASFRQQLKRLLSYKKNKSSGRIEWQWNTTIDNCKDCISTFQKLLSLHREQISNLNNGQNDYKDIHWGNSNDTRGLPLEWAIAKIFMPMGNEKNCGPEDTDPSAMFSLMEKCDLFTHPIKHTNLQQLIAARNSLFHSPDNFVSDGTVEDYFRVMINLLRDASNDQEVDQSIRDRIREDIKKIEKLKDSKMTIAILEDAQKAIRITRKAICNDFEERQCHNDPGQLEELLKVAKNLGSDLKSLNDNFDNLKCQKEQTAELVKAVNEKENMIENLKKRRDEEQGEIPEMKDHLKEKERKSLEIEEQRNEITLLKKELNEQNIKIEYLTRTSAS